LILDVIAAEARPASIDGTVDVARPAADRCLFQSNLIVPEIESGKRVGVERRK
jgi:hypothetical protein